MKFYDRFIKVLEQDAAGADVPDETATTAAGPEAEQAAMASTVDKGTNIKDYDVPVPKSLQTDQAKAAQVAGLKEWISTIDDFIDYLNAPNPNSIQSKLHAAGCDTMYDDIARSEKKKIARLAAELSSLAESLKGYLISSNA
jgi:hypothetical protein